MQCGCPECGAFMAQVQQGLKSHCKCSDCGFECHDCMGGNNEKFRPITRELAELMRRSNELDK